jgi:stearoyl-CoA desaturase (delta-9 desaturase)
MIPAFMYGEWWMFLLGFLWWQLIAIVAISGGYHRYYSHKSFETSKFYEPLVNILGMFSGAGPVLSWVGSHRKHHSHSDTEKDPHSYKFKGFWKVYTNVWGYDATIERKYIKDLISNKLVRWFYINYFNLNIILIFTLFYIHPLLLTFAYALPVVLAFHGYSILNTLGHKDGMPNNTIVGNILTAGEGWHLNHHEDSRNYKIGKKWWQFDPTAYFIKLIKTND